MSRLPRTTGLLGLAEIYLDRCQHERNSDFRTNGECEALKNYVSNGGIVFDVGANTGDWAHEALTINPNIKIHCFEADPTVFKILEKRYGSDDRLRLTEMAMGSKTGTMVFHSFGGRSRCGTLVPQSDIAFWQDHQEIKVEVSTLDAYALSQGISKIDYIKVDVEGFDVDVLRGAEGLMEAGAIKAVQVEYSSGYIFRRHTVHDLFEIANRHGYDVHIIAPEGPILLPEYNTRLDNARTKNFLLTPER